MHFIPWGEAIVLNNQNTPHIFDEIYLEMIYTGMNHSPQNEFSHKQTNGTFIKI